MASIEKNSVREEFDKIKQNLHDLSKKGKVSDEAALLIKSLIMLFEVVLSIFMEKKTKKNSANSSIPPSQTDADESSTDSSGNNKKSRKRQPKKGTFSNQRERVRTRTIRVDSCSNCGEDLSDQAADGVERRTLIDILFEKVTEHTDAEIKTCGCCNSVAKGRFPSNLHGTLQYGRGVKAYLLNLLIVQMISLNRLQQMAFSLIGQMISEAVVLKYVLQLNYALEKWETDSASSILLQKAINSDETSLRVDKRKQWIHVYSSGDTVLKFLHPKRKRPIWGVIVNA